MIGIQGRAVSAIVAVSLAATLGCAGTYTPPPPLWDPGLYTTLGVLPVRVQVSTGAPPFTSTDTDLSNRLSGLSQEALAAALRYRGYEVLPPLDLNERLMDEEDLSRAFMQLAATNGLVEGVSPPDAGEQAVEAASVLASALQADLLVLAGGTGEYHSATEHLVQDILTGILTKGREQRQAPPSFLAADILFIDPGAGRRVARIRTGQMPYTDELIPLTRSLDRSLRRVPKREPLSPAGPPPPPPQP